MIQVLKVTQTSNIQHLGVKAPRSQPSLTRSDVIDQISQAQNDNDVIFNDEAKSILTSFIDSEDEYEDEEITPANIFPNMPPMNPSTFTFWRWWC